jgi:archaemetzincin
MKAIHLLAVEASRAGAAAGPAATVPLLLLDQLAAALARVFHVSCHVRTETLDAGFAFEPVRNQFHSTAILQRLQALPCPEGTCLLGITGLDLFVPVLTFVFGEAQLQGRCALVSLHRLREEFYGLPPNNHLLQERLVKEAVHELGHNFGLRHCDDWECVMASTHAVERLDVKSAGFCADCWRRITAVAPALALR